MGRNWRAFLLGAILAAFAGSCIPPEPPPPTCEAQVSVEQVLATPTRITPDGNGIFDDASIRALVRVRGLGPTCAGLDDLMLDFLDVEVDLVAGGGQGATVRQFREAVPLTAGLCENEECSAKVSYTWDGRDRRGRVLPDGERVVPVLHASLAVLAEPSGQPRALASSQQTASAITVSAKHDAAEDAWLEVQAIEASIGTRAEDPTALPSDWPYRYEDASAATLAALADASARARQLDLPAAFDQRLQHVLADSDVTVKPDASQIAAWQKVFLDSRGSTEVEWGDRGARQAVWLLDAGPA